MSHTPRALVIRAEGTNCDAELVRGLRAGGATPTLVHVRQALAQPEMVDDFDLIALPGGFSYGDDVASGRIFAMRLRERLYPALLRAIDRRCPILGVCNGFQVLVQLGLLPGPPPGAPWPTAQPPRQVLSLAQNADARFSDTWVSVRADAGSACVWTRPLASGYTPGVLRLPVAHGEGRLVALDDATMRDLEKSGRVALRYAEPFNGSAGDAAGVCDTTGLIFGLMPHPERFIDWNRHPAWTRLDEAAKRGDPPGLAMLRAGIEAAPRAARARRLVTSATR